jgi:hypothetical protein
MNVWTDILVAYTEKDGAREIVGGNGGSVQIGKACKAPNLLSNQTVSKITGDLSVKWMWKGRFD